MQKSGLFSKTPSSILLKSHKKYPFGSITMSENDGQTLSLKNFQGGKIEIFGPSQSPTGIKGATDQMLPWKALNDPKTLHMGILHDYKSCWPPMGPFRYPRGAQKGPFGLKQTLTGRKAPERPREAGFGPNCHRLVWQGWNYGYHTLWLGIGPLLGHQGP